MFIIIGVAVAVVVFNHRPVLLTECIRSFVRSFVRSFNQSFVLLSAAHAGTLYVHFDVRFDEGLIDGAVWVGKKVDEQESLGQKRFVQLFAFL